MATRPSSFHVACSDLPEGWAFSILKKLTEFGCGYQDSLFTEDQEKEIKAYALGNSAYIPGGWIEPDPWRLRSLEKLDKVKTIIPKNMLEDIFDNLLTVDSPEEVPHEWKVPPPADLQGIGDAGFGLGSSSGSIRARQPGARPPDASDRAPSEGDGVLRKKYNEVCSSVLSSVTGHPDGTMLYGCLGKYC